MADFSSRHPVLTGIVKIVGVAGLAATVDAVANGGRSISSNGSTNDHTYTPSRRENASFNDGCDEVNGDTIETDASVERSSPIQHIVRPHTQHYIKNGERVLMEKDSYLRGGKKDE